MTYLESYETIGLARFLGMSSALVLAIYSLFWLAMWFVRIHPEKSGVRSFLLRSFYFFGVSPFLILVLSFFGIGTDPNQSIGHFLVFPCGLAISAASYFHYSRV